ncbi:hypothetical protein AB1K62_03620 [Parasphingorhabdus sp. JC815]|uniref:hypothetical protein n=1 Tax=Parasphingorhabdus sp. JC815 TaxID=3232140 RepID=UPI00345AA164
MSAAKKTGKLANMSRTDVSAVISVLLFTLTILISAVGPAGAQGPAISEDGIISPTVSYKA